jgi:FkbM family methyltransferase
VIFGAGNWGRQFARITEGWKCFVDTNPQTNELDGLPVVSYADFVRHYKDEIVVISSRLYYEAMYGQLLKCGIPSEKIVNAGYVLNEFSKLQYFDLEALKREEQEIFVDAGSLDGMSSISFLEWCQESKQKGIYAFEPDACNIRKIYHNLEKMEADYKVIPKGCWSEETTLRFCAKGNGDSAIDFQGREMIEVTTIDKELQGKKITFIKMDIEGAESQALYGAKDIITKNKPKLAISIYHKPEDIWEIPAIIMQYYPGYRFYLRHYSLAYSETVLYALP